MHKNNQKSDPRFKLLAPDGDRPHPIATTRNFTSEQLLRLWQEHPELKLANHPSEMQLLQMLIADTEDSDLQDQFAEVYERKLSEYAKAGDIYFGNYPATGSVVYPADFIPIAYMPTQDPVGVTVNQMPCNVIFSGPTGSAKTSLLSVLLAHPLLLATTRVITFTRKRELRHLATIPDIADGVLTFPVEDLQPAFYQSPPGVSDTIWNNDLSRTTAQAYGLFSAQRLMNQEGARLLEHHPPGVYPTLRQLVEVLEKYRPRDYMRDAQLKTSIVGCLQDLLACTGTIWDHSSSNFLELLFSTPGLAIIEAPSLPQQHLTFLATFMMRWAYLWRVYSV